MGTNEYSQLASKSWDSQNFGDVNMVLKWPIFTSPQSHNELIGCEFYAAKADGVDHCWQFHVLAVLSLLCPPYNRYQLIWTSIVAFIWETTNYTSYTYLSCSTFMEWALSHP